MLIIQVIRRNLLLQVQLLLKEKNAGLFTTDTYNDWLVIGFTPMTLFTPEKKILHC